MAYRKEKDGDIIIDGWEKGIASSPHKGIANIQNANISTEIGEVTTSFVRAKNNPQGAIAGGTLTASVSDGTTKLAAPATLYAGQWISVSGSTITGAVNGTASIDYLVVAGGGAGGAGTSAAGGFGGGGGAGGMRTGSSSVSVQSYSITVGAGGTGGSGDGGNGSNSVINTIVTSTGGGGGGLGNGLAPSANNGKNGGSAGGGGAAPGTGSSGGTGTVGQGNDGGAGVSAATGAGGGGGAGAVGGAPVTTTGGVGGAGTASSISGSSVTYAGGGGAPGNGAAGAGGAGGGGAGGTNAGAGVAGTANTGGGGGGSQYNAGTVNGGNGGSGVVIISYVTGTMTATGGTITTSGSNTIHTFTTSGTFTVTGVALSGNYYVSYKDSSNKIKLSQYYDPLCQHAIVHSTSGTATFSTVAVLGNPISKATEKYANATSTQYRYYILDSSGYVWVYDTAVYADSLASSGTAITWMLPDPTDNSALSLNSIAILNGWLMALNNLHIYGKPTVNLGAAFVAINDGNLNNPFPTHSNYAYVGHQGRMYYCDGIYIGSLFPDTSLVTGVPNIQSYGSYTAVTTTGTITALVGGSLPNNNSSVGIRIPAVFFTDQYGTQPTNLTVDTVYYIQNGAASTTFAVYDVITGGSPIDIAAGAAGNQYFNTFYPLGGDSGANGSKATVTFSPQRLNLPFFEVAKTIAEVGNQVLIGCQGNVVYPWNQVDVTPAGIISLPEANVQNILTVNQVAYMFAGNQGNIYITDGSLASMVLNVPDYVAGVPGSPATYIESTYTWGDSMYLRGRVYFSVLDQSSTKAGNCGGIWSFVPTQNMSSEQETGLALRLESQNSYGSYNGVDTLLIQNAVQDAQQPLYWSAWYSSVSAPTYGIDYSTGGTSATSPAIIETDFVPIGTMLNKTTTSQLEYKLGAPLDSTATITAKYRVNTTDSWRNCAVFQIDPSRLSAYAEANFEKLQWVQFQLTLTPATSSASTNTFIRFREIRLR